MNSLLKTISAAVLLLFSATAIYAQSTSDAYEIYTFSSVEALRADVKTSGGSIEFMGTETNEVRVEMYVRRGGRYLSKSDTDLEDFDLEVSLRGNSLKAHANRKSGNTRGWFNSGNQISVSFKVYLPKNGVVKGSTSGGGVAAENLNGEVELRTSGGSVRLNGISGTVDARTSGGSITINDVNGSLDARTSGGSIRASGAHGTINLRTSGGSIRIEDCSGQVDAHTSGGSITANLEEVSERLNLRTSGGSITMAIPGGRGYNLDLSGSGVRADLVNFSGTSERNRIRGTVHGGGPEITASTSGGTVRVNYK
jgi:DUF4097 and DUF4098 domain-containing protein YvlB